MSLLPITFACGDYDRVATLRDGRVPVEGCALTCFDLEPEELFPRVLKNHEFDVTEFSFSSYMMMVGRGAWEYVAIPVFPSRMFRHAAIFVNAKSGIAKPEDLKGRRVGVPSYQMTAALVARGLLSDEYGVKPGDVTWVLGELEHAGHVAPPPGVKVKFEHVDDRPLSTLIAEGKIDALITASMPTSFNGDGKVVRLFKNSREAEHAYYAKTKIYPIMHVLVLRRTLAEQYQWLPASLMKAMEQAKAHTLKTIDGHGGVLPATLPWLVLELEETRALMGKDFWPYGVAANKPTLDAMTRWSHEQGLTPRRLAPEDLFVKSTLEQFKV